MSIGTKKIEDYLPIVKYNEGLYTELPVTIAGDLIVTGTTTIAGVSLTDLTVTGNTVIGNAVTDTLAITGASTITSTSSSALTVGANGATNPVLKIVASTASVATGVSVTGAAATGGVAVAVISSGTNENLTIDAKGSGTITIGGVSTGAVVLPATVNVASAATIAGVGTGANGIILKNLKNSAASALSGTQLDIAIDIGGTPYYFTVYPTKA